MHGYGLWIGCHVILHVSLTVATANVMEPMVTRSNLTRINNVRGL